MCLISANKFRTIFFYEKANNKNLHAPKTGAQFAYIHDYALIFPLFIHKWENTTTAAEGSVFAICRTWNIKHKMIQLKWDLINRKYFLNPRSISSFEFLSSRRSPYGNTSLIFGYFTAAVSTIRKDRKLVS
jgi:uncharacterized membrane protein YgdD (TMEM256/DUF423 family)